MDEPRIMILVGFPHDQKRLNQVCILKYVPPPGAMLVPCDCCASPTWIGPKQLARKRKNPEIEFICANCLNDELTRLDPADADVQFANCGGKSGSIYMADGRAFLPDPPKQN